MFQDIPKASILFHSRSGQTYKCFDTNIIVTNNNIEYWLHSSLRFFASEAIGHLLWSFPPLYSKHESAGHKGSNTQLDEISHPPHATAWFTQGKVHARARGLSANQTPAQGSPQRRGCTRVSCASPTSFNLHTYPGTYPKDAMNCDFCDPRYPYSPHRSY